MVMNDDIHTFGVRAVQAPPHLCGNFLEFSILLSSSQNLKVVNTTHTHPCMHMRKSSIYACLHIWDLETVCRHLGIWESGVHRCMVHVKVSFPIFFLHQSFLSQFNPVENASIHVKLVGLPIHGDRCVRSFATT